MRVIPLIVLAIPVAALPVFPQSQRPTFEVASMPPAAMLGGQLRRKVIDKTNLPGKFDYTLTWSGSSSPIPALPPAGGDAPTAAEPAGPSIFTAIQEQLGLRLESTRGPVEVVVIDSVQRPSEN